MPEGEKDLTSVSVAVAPHQNLNGKNAMAQNMFLVRQKKSEIKD